MIQTRLFHPHKDNKQRSRLNNDQIILCLLMAEQAASITRAAGLDAVYQADLNQLKKDDAEIESASKDGGIKTAVQVTGKYRQTVRTWR